MRSIRAHKSKRAIEVQQYASPVTLTVSVCCDLVGINHFNILNGASNALEMVEFFNEALVEKNEIGNPMFNRGDVIIMDNWFSPSKTSRTITERTIG